MKRLNLEHLRVENLLSFGKLDINFAQFQPGLVGIRGQCGDNPGESNGAGKSSIFEIINWVLFDQTIKGIGKDDMVRWGQKKGKGTLTLGDGQGHQVRITRHRGTSNKLLVEYKEDGGEWQPRTRRTPTMTQEFISKFLAIDFSIWRNSIMMGQGDQGKFMDGTDKEKKDCVGGVLGFGILDRALEAVRLLKRAIEKDLTGREAQLEVLVANRDTLVDGLAKIDLDELQRIIAIQGHKVTGAQEVHERLLTQQAQQTKLVEAQEELDKLVGHVQTLDEDLKTALEKWRDEWQKMDDLHQEVGPLRKTYQEVEANLFDVDNKIGEHPSTDEELRAATAEVSAIRATLLSGNVQLNTYREAVEMTGECPVCLTKLTDEHRIVIGKLIEGQEGVMDGTQQELQRASAREAAATEANQTLKDLKRTRERLVRGRLDLASRLKQAEQAGERKASVEEMVEQLKSSHTTSKQEAEQRIEKLHRDLEGAELDGEIDAKMERARLDVRDEQYKLEGLKGDLTRYHQGAEQLEGLKEQMAAMEAEFGKQKKQHHLILAAEKVFGQAGLRAWILERMLPVLKMKVNNLLAEITSKELHIEFTPVEKFDVLVHEGPRITPWNGYSGGEKKLVIVAFQLAFAELILEDAQRGFGFAVADEVFTDMDERHKLDNVEMLNQWAVDHEVLLFVISNQKDIEEAVEAGEHPQLRIVKRDGISELVA